MTGTFLCVSAVGVENGLSTLLQKREAGSDGPVEEIRTVVFGKRAQKTRTTVMRVVSLRKLRFSQRSVSSRFKNGAQCATLCNQIAANTDYVQLLRPLRVVKVSGVLVSLDNRRLACLNIVSHFLNRPFTVNVEYWNLSQVSRSRCQASKLLFYLCSIRKGRSVKVRGRLCFPQNQRRRRIFSCVTSSE